MSHINRMTRARSANRRHGFAGELGETRLKRLYAWWVGLSHDGRLPPLRSRFNPMDMAPFLANVALVDVSFRPGEPLARVKLAGAALESFYGRSMKGNSLDGVEMGAEAASLAQLVALATTQCRAVYEQNVYALPIKSKSGKVAKKPASVTIRRLALPLAEEDGSIRQMLLAQYVACDRPGARIDASCLADLETLPETRHLIDRDPEEEAMLAASAIREQDAA
ncbi:MAG: hypothetical protein Alpg2KO_21330 [Alphaproteobacteria bacterium]